MTVYFFRTLAVVSVLILASCSDDAPPPQTVEVGIVSLQPETVMLTTELTGRTVAALVSDVRPQVSGIIKSRDFQEGAAVKAGDVLYQIDPATYQAAVDQAEADLASAGATVEAARLKNERYQDLLKIEGVSQQEADDAQSSARQAIATVALKKAALATARINLGYTKVRAPISGRIGKSTVTPGALVTANQETALSTIRALDPIYVDMPQSSADLLRLRKDVPVGDNKTVTLKVRLKLEDGSTYESLGTLQFQEVAVDEATGTVTLRAQFPNPNGILLPGMFVRAVVDQAENDSAILAPQQGITRDAKGDAVAMVVGADNKVEQRTVVADRTLGDRWIVTSGLAAGDQLIVEGLGKIRPGVVVKPVAAAPSKK